jgi:hypothetical protein
VNVALLNRYICEVVFKLGEDVGGQIDSAEHSLAGMLDIVVHRRKRAHKASKARAKDSLQKPMVGCLHHSTLMRGWAITCCR